MYYLWRRSSHGKANTSGPLFRYLLTSSSPTSLVNPSHPPIFLLRLTRLRLWCWSGAYCRMLSKIQSGCIGSLHGSLEGKSNGKVSRRRGWLRRAVERFSSLCYFVGYIVGKVIWLLEVVRSWGSKLIWVCFILLTKRILFDILDTWNPIMASSLCIALQCVWILAASLFSSTVSFNAKRIDRKKWHPYVKPFHHKLCSYHVYLDRLIHYTSLVEIFPCPQILHLSSPGRNLTQNLSKKHLHKMRFSLDIREVCINMWDKHDTIYLKSHMFSTREIHGCTTSF